jgi:hypothetical protein
MPFENELISLSRSNNVPLTSVKSARRLLASRATIDFLILF